MTDVIGLDFKTAVSKLAGYSLLRPTSYIKTYEPPKKRDLVIPERADNMRKVFAYLCQTRKIDSEIVSEIARNGLLYQDKRGNAVFVHRDDSGKIIGAELQGTNSYQRFKGVAAGTSDSLFAVKIGEPNRAYVFESVIDLLSFKMLANQVKIQNSVLVSMAGLKPNSLKALSERGLELYAYVDNDEAGIKFTKSNGLIPCNRILAENSVNDYNELLQTIERNRAAVKISNRYKLPKNRRRAKLKLRERRIKNAERKSTAAKKRSSFAPTLKSPFRILRMFFVRSQKRRSGFKGGLPYALT